MSERKADFNVLLFHNDELLIETWNNGLGSVSVEIAACKSRVADPADPATHMQVISSKELQLPPQPWADLTGYTAPQPAPRQKRVRRTGPSLSSRP